MTDLDFMTQLTCHMQATEVHGGEAVTNTDRYYGGQLMTQPPGEYFSYARKHGFDATLAVSPFGELVLSLRMSRRPKAENRTPKAESRESK